MAPLVIRRNTTPKLKIKRTKKPSEYWSLHSHSRFSDGDALPSPKAMVQRAKELGYPALAITDHGNISATVQLYTECKKAGIKPLPGSELYFVWDREDKELKNKRYHLCVAAYTTQGYRNLVEISTRTHENFHFKPNFDWNDMAQWHEEGLTEGIALTTGCYFGLVVQTLITKGYDAALQIVENYSRYFDTYVEIQAHHIDHGEGIMSEQDIAEALKSIADELLLPVVITQDSHYVHENEREYHETLKELVSWSPNPDEAKFPGDGFHMVDEQWMKEHHPKHIYEAGIIGLKHLLDKHDMCIEEMEEYHYSVPEVHRDPVTYMRERVQKRAQELGLTGKVYTERIEKELEIIEFARMSDYMVLVAEVCDHMRETEMFYQIRGSAAGSLVSYLLDISNVDPVEWNLAMERFLSKDRTKPPDIDIDIEHSRRQELITWCQSKYATVQICTNGTLSMDGDDEDNKGSLRVKALSAMRKKTGEASWADMPEQDVKRLQELSEMELLSGYSKHAAGLVLCSDQRELRSKVPQMYIASSKTMVSQYNGKDVESIGVVKLDVLGVKTLTVMRQTIQALGREPADGLDFIPLKDKNTYKMLARGNTAGVFQLEGGTSTRYIRELAPSKIEDVIAAMALFRPGVMKSGAMSSYLLRKAGVEGLPERHSVIHNATKQTQGILLYQDIVIDILRELGMESDDLTEFLKAVKASNKNVEAAKATMDKYEPIVEQMCRDAGMSEADIAWLWEAFAAFADYSFNKCVVSDTVLSMITEETEVHKSSSNHHQGVEMTVGELYSKLHNRKPGRRGNPTIVDACMSCGATQETKYKSGQCNKCAAWYNQWQYRGLRILAHKDGRAVPDKLLDVVCNGEQQVVKISLHDGKSITCTPNHKHLTDEGLWKETKDLAPGDHLLVVGPYEVTNYKGMYNYTPPRLKTLVDIRAKGKCEQCGETEGRLEYAHLDSNHRHNKTSNVKLLCNSCHKKLDYEFGSRKKKWSKGRPLVPVAISSIEDAGVQMTYDVCMEGDDHSWVGNGIVTHNSHATVYGITAYRCAWLSNNYPLEWHAALLNVASENNDEQGKKKVASYIKSARSRGVMIRQPDINKSVVGYGSDGKNIRKGLSTIQGIGIKAATELVKHQPYGSVMDICEKVNRKQVTGIKDYLASESLSVGTLKALDESGALNSIKE